MTGWRYVGASAIGSAHVEQGLPCQDAGRIHLALADGGEVLVLVAADGAGSAPHSDLGSALACESVVSSARAWLTAEGGRGVLAPGTVEEWLLQAQGSIAERSAADGAPIRDYACTLLVAVVGEDWATFAQLGDGVIVVGAEGGFVSVFWPQTGEYANTTFFLTDPEALSRVAYDVHRGRVSQIAVLTDGLQALALVYADEAVHAPFFRPFFERLSAQPPGEAAELEEPLLGFLLSERVISRTDDDKTLLLATRSDANQRPHRSS